MKGEPPVFYKSSGLLFFNIIPEMIVVVEVVVFRLDCMYQIIIEISGTCTLKAGVELLLCSPLIFAVQPGIDFCCKGVAFTGIAVDKSLFYSLLGAAIVIDICCIKICSARLDEHIHHSAYLRDIYCLAICKLRQPHKTESQLEHIFPKIV